MSLFAGVSVITEGKHCTTSPINVGTDSGYHLLVVRGYSRTVQENPNEEAIISGPFMVGGHKWCLGLCPNGYDKSSTDFISVYIFLDDVYTEEVVKVHSMFSFVDQVDYQKPMRICAAEPSEPQSMSSESGDSVCAKFVKRDALERSTHLKDDCFTLRCDIIVCKDSKAHDVSGTISDVGQHLDYLLQNKLGADVTFEVSGEMFAAHRCVLAARSTVFMAQLFGPMKEGTTSSVIQIKDMEPRLFRALLSFIYTGTFPEMDKDNNMKEDKPKLVEEEEEAEYVMWLQGLFVAADMYDVQRLKFLCEEMMSEYIGVSTVAYTIALAEQHHCQGLKEACLKFIQGQTIPCLEKVMETDGWELIISTCPSVLKEIIAKTASSQKDKKRKR